MGFFDTISRGFSLTVASIRIAMKEPWMFVLPVISGVLLAALLVALIFTTLVTSTVAGLSGDSGGALFMAGVFILYFMGYFLFYFSSAMVIFGAKERFDGRDPTIGKAFSASLGVVPKLALLAVIGGIIGLISSALSRRDSRGNPNIIGQMLAAIIGVAWTVISYFSLPVILAENIGVTDSFKRSIALVQKSWGEGVTASISLSFLTLPGTALVFIGLLLFGFGQGTGSSGGVGIAIAIIGAIAFFVGYIISIPVKAIVSQALYVYATTGTVPTGFEADHLAGFYQKN